MASLPPTTKKQVFFEDVEVGTSLPPLVKGPYTVMMMAKYASMYGDFYPAHYDTKWATELDRIPTAVAHGYQVVTFSSQLVTDWMSPDGFLKKLSTQVRTQTYVGDVLTYKGEVTKKYVKDGENIVECSVSAEKQDGTLVLQGIAIVALPARAGKK